MAAFIAAQRTGYQIPRAVSCRALGVSRSWHYKWSSRGLPPRTARRERLKAEIRRLFGAHEGKYGSPRITADLKDAGWAVSKNTVAALMRETGLAARPKKKRRSATRVPQQLELHHPRATARRHYTPGSWEVIIARTLSPDRLAEHLVVAELTVGGAGRTVPGRAG